MIVRKTLAALPLHGIVDLEAEKSRLAKEIAKLTAMRARSKRTQQRRFRRPRAGRGRRGKPRKTGGSFSRVEKLEAARARLSGL